MRGQGCRLTGHFFKVLLLSRDTCTLAPAKNDCYRGHPRGTLGCTGHGKKGESQVQKFSCVCQAVSQGQSSDNRKPSRPTDVRAPIRVRKACDLRPAQPWWAATYTHSAGSGMGSAIILDSSSAISFSFHFRRWTYSHRALARAGGSRVKGSGPGEPEVRLYLPCPQAKGSPRNEE